jgi:hypothetical protein
MAAVADDLYALGLGFGMYSDAGKYICGGYAGNLSYCMKRQMPILLPAGVWII